MCKKKVCARSHLSGQRVTRWVLVVICNLAPVYDPWPSPISRRKVEAGPIVRPDEGHLSAVCHPLSFPVRHTFCSRGMVGFPGPPRRASTPSRWCWMARQNDCAPVWTSNLRLRVLRRHSIGGRVAFPFDHCTPLAQASGSCESFSAALGAGSEVQLPTFGNILVSLRL